MCSYLIARIQLIPNSIKLLVVIGFLIAVLAPNTPQDQITNVIPTSAEKRPAQARDRIDERGGTTKNGLESEVKEPGQKSATTTLSGDKSDALAPTEHRQNDFDERDNTADTPSDSRPAANPVPPTNVQVPLNAHIDVLGNGWDCDRGYFRSGNGCARVQVPADAHIDVLGSGWDCDRGYLRSGSGCTNVRVPLNAHIDVLGNGWDCDRGYFRSGNECLKVQVPPNAHIDVLGSGWECDRGYFRSGNSCTKG
jgi:hypothetical protein